MTADGPLADVMRGHLGDGHIPAPSGHAPRLETQISNGYHGVVVKESGTDMGDGAWIHCEEPVEARQ